MGELPDLQHKNLPLADRRSQFGVRPAKAAFFSVLHPAAAPAGSDRIGHGEGHLATDEGGGNR